MTPEQCRKEIQSAYHLMIIRSANGEINESCISGIIESRCMDAARHNGIPNSWRNYLPYEMRRKPKPVYVSNKTPYGKPILTVFQTDEGMP